MSELLEGLFQAASKADNEFTACNHEPDKTGWRAVLEGNTESSLIPNLKRDRSIRKPIWPPRAKPPSIDFCRKGSPGRWPSQAHHLIPWQQLAKHKAKGYIKAGRGSKLLKDANYSINHGNNGKFLPYASSLKEWAASRAKQQLAEKLMTKLGMQLHQGPHSMKSYGGGKKGYKKRVAELLDTMFDDETMHVTVCSECIKKGKNKKFPPRKQVTRKLDSISSRLEKEISKGSIFVSRRAYFWWAS